MNTNVVNASQYDEKDTLTRSPERSAFGSSTKFVAGSNSESSTISSDRNQAASFDEATSSEESPIPQNYELDSVVGKPN